MVQKKLFCVKKSSRSGESSIDSIWYWNINVSFVSATQMVAGQGKAADWLIGPELLAWGLFQSIWWPVTQYIPHLQFVLGLLSTEQFCYYVCCKCYFLIELGVPTSTHDMTEYLFHYLDLERVKQFRTSVAILRSLPLASRLSIGEN